jgi:hypothetical protein
VRGPAAVITSRTPLLYEQGADTARDRPAHVRAASSIAATREGFAVVQDDANFVALIDPSGRVLRSIELPAGPDGLRQFDDQRGNKAHKLDLEACVTVNEPQGTLLIALGSGSTAGRESVVLVRWCESDRPDISVVHLPRLYEALRHQHAFAGSELNIEGAIVVDDRLRLFGRGNGAARAGIDPANATCDLDWRGFLAHVHAPADSPPPLASNVARFDLGHLDGIALGFTDAAHWSGAMIYSAAAEASPDATRDGTVAGSAIGVFNGTRVRWALLVDASGARVAAKVEGITPVRGASDRVHVVIDADDPNAPSELCTVELQGDWGV